MIQVPRQRPPRIPAIHPLPEYLAEGQIKEWYDDMKSVLQVPWMGVVTMAYAHYPKFFEAFWTGLRPICASEPYVAASRAMREHIEARVAKLNPPPMVERLLAMGYAQREIQNIRDLIEVFSHGNFAYGPMVAAIQLLLAGGELGEGGTPPPFKGRHAPDIKVPFVLVEAHHADAPTRAVYEDIKATLKLPFVNTDYRALARWPSYFALAWDDIKGVVGTEAHEAEAKAVHDHALDIARQMPNPAGLASADLLAAAEQDASAEEIREVANLFFYLIPGLVVNVAYFRHQLLDG